MYMWAVALTCLFILKTQWVNAESFSNKERGSMHKQYLQVCDHATLTMLLPTFSFLCACVIKHEVYMQLEENS